MHACSAERAACRTVLCVAPRGQYSTRDGSSQPADGRRQPASRWQEGRRAAALGELQPCQQMLGNAWPCGSSDQPMDRHLSWRGGEQRRPGAHDHHGSRRTPWPWEDRPARSCLSQANRADACGSADDRTSRGSGRHRQVTRKTRRPKAMPMPAEVSSMRKASSHRSRTRQRRAQAGLCAGGGGRIPRPYSAVL